MMDHEMVWGLLCQHGLGGCAWKGETGSRLWVKWCGWLALCTSSFGSLSRGATQSAAPPVWEWGTESGKQEVLCCLYSSQGPVPHCGSPEQLEILQPHQPHSGGLATGPELWEVLVSLLALFWAGWPWPVCAEVSTPGHACEAWCWDGIWARAQQVLALLPVENRKPAGWCLLSMPDLGQAAPLFTLTLTLALIFYDSLSWSSAGRLHLEKAFVGGLSTHSHMWVHTPSFTDTQPSLMSGEMAIPCSSPKLFFIWINGRLGWKHIVCLIYNGLIRQIKRAFLPVFSNQNMPPSLFAYLLNLCCPNRAQGIFAMAKVKSSSPVIRWRAQEDLENAGVILLQSISWKFWGCHCSRWIWLLFCLVLACRRWDVKCWWPQLFLNSPEANDALWDLCNLEYSRECSGQKEE